MTHFFASTGTCGTISGTGKFLKAMSGNRVKVHGIYPEIGHDIPGVRSIPQLKMTEHYKPDSYDGLVDVSNAEAFDMCLRLNREESIIAGPSSGMQVVGALKVMKDEPGNVGVVIFCDDIFKYTTSVTRHCPAIFDAPAPAMASAEIEALKAVMGVAKEGPDTLQGAALAKLGPVIEAKGPSAPLVIDVRIKDEFQTRLRIQGAVNVPMADLTGQSKIGDEVVRILDAPGAVQKKPQANGSASAQPYSSVLDALKAALGRDVAPDQPMLLVCNRGIDSLMSLLVLKGAGFKAVQHVERGMFAWKESGLPLDSGPENLHMPPAANAAEEELLKRLGYDREGKPEEY